MKSKTIFILVMITIIYSQGKYVNYGLPYYSIQLSTRTPRNSDTSNSNLQQSVIGASFITKTKGELSIDFVSGNYISKSMNENTQMKKISFPIFS